MTRLATPITSAIGVQVAQAEGRSALCVAAFKPQDPSRIHGFTVRHLQALPSGTPFHELAKRLGEITHKVLSRGNGRPMIFVNLTGLGDPVGDLMRESVPTWCPVYAAHINRGDRRVLGRRHRIQVGKAYLVTRLQMLLQSGKLELPRTQEAENVADDLLKFTIPTIGHPDRRQDRTPFQVGSQDELVTALGLAVHLDHRSFTP